MINGTMALILVAEACAVVLIWCQPVVKRQIADWLNASADSDDWRAIRHNEYKKQREQV